MRSVSGDFLRMNNRTAMYYATMHNLHYLCRCIRRYSNIINMRKGTTYFFGLDLMEKMSFASVLFC